MAKYKSIDLFAGIGGIRLGFDRAFGDEISTVFVSEWDEYAQKTYKANFYDNFEIAGDITKINEHLIPDHDILCGGFPCQPFSISGKQLGFEDSRGTLFFDIIRIVHTKKPKIVFLENVANLAKHNESTTIKHMIDLLERENYKVFIKEF